jgi:uncharacterized protein YjbJ (UPF0337 family)
VGWRTDKIGGSAVSATRALLALYAGERKPPPEVSTLPIKRTEANGSGGRRGRINPSSLLLRQIRISGVDSDRGFATRHRKPKRRAPETLGSLATIANREIKKMNWNQVEGNWKQFKGKVKEKWGDLTDDDLDRIAGKRAILAGHIQEKYGMAQEEAEKQLKEWEKSDA